MRDKGKVWDGFLKGLWCFFFEVRVGVVVIGLRIVIFKNYW